MPKIEYVPKNFRDGALEVIEQAEAICDAYAAQGFDLTLRQVYYQFVSRGLIANKDSEYKRLGSIINDARLAGLLDWDHIVDRTRNLRSLSHWDSPADVIASAAHSFRFDKWAEQAEYVEAWIEKDALVGVLEQACEPMDVPFFSCRGYTSQSEIWGAAQRLGKQIAAGKVVTVIHLGDHDPSGIDMSRDIEDRLRMFIAQDEFAVSPYMEDYDDEEARRLEYGIATMDIFSVERIALNWDQVQQYNPPPNPAKLTDARARGYVERFGGQSWELDALEPTVLVALIQGAIAAHRDDELWEAALDREQTEKDVLRGAARRWADVSTWLAS